MDRRALVGLLGACLFMPLRALGSGQQPSARVAAEEVVSFNTKSLKYHCRKCRTIGNCTNCVDMALSKARERGVACKVCRGSCG